MKFLIIIIISVCTTASGRKAPETIKFSAEDARTRRDAAVSYTTSVVHGNSKYPDQHAESSIKVDLQTNRQQHKQSQRKRPKSISEQIPSQQTYTQRPHKQYQDDNTQHEAQSQAFNVGYSVSFNGKPQKTQPAPRQTHQSEEIITGSRKEVVEKPNSEFDSQEFVNNALIEIKKQKISGIKPKYNKFHLNKDNEGKSFISNLAPKTQQYLSYLEDTKPYSAPNSPFRQQLQPTTESLDSSWTSLSPTVEIYHSKELSSALNKENTNHFDHARALGRSQGFDYSNVQDRFNKNNSPSRGHFKHSEQVLDNFNSAPSHTSVQYLPVQSIQMPQKSTESHPSHRTPPKLPIDLSLIRNPILTLTGKKMPSDSHTLPISFDTRLLQAMQQNFAAPSRSNEALPTNKGQGQTLLGNSGVIGGQVQTLHGQSYQAVHPNPTFNIQGNPQPPVFSKNENFDQYFNRYLENLQPQETRAGSFAVPYQRFNYNSRINDATNIEMDLRPPPIPINRGRRAFIY